MSLVLLSIPSCRLSTHSYNKITPLTMSNKELIVSLIQQDLKHSQLVLGLDELGMEASDKHCLDILDIVYNLMKVPGGAH